MAIDASIYGNIRQPEGPNALDSLTKASALGETMIKSQQMRQSIEDQNAIRSAYTSNTGQDGSLNRAGVLSHLAQNAPHLVQSQKTQFAQGDAAEADAKKKVLQDNLERFSTAYRLASTATDQQSWDSMRNEMQGMGLDATHLPQQFNPQYADMLRKRSAYMTLDAKQGLDAIDKMSKVGIEEAKAPLDREHTKSQIAKDWSEIGKIKNDTRDQGAKMASDLRKERSGLGVTKNTTEVSVAYNKIRTAAQGTPSAASDMALIYGFMKMLDPGTGVKEGEYASATNAASIPEWIRNQYNKAKDGTLLQPSQRDGFITQAGGIWKAQKAQQDKIDAGFRSLAEKNKLDPKDVLLNFDADPDHPGSMRTSSNDLALAKQIAKEVQKPAASSGGGLVSTASASESSRVSKPVSTPPPKPKPKVGTESKGYVYLGGDPSKPESWKKAR